MAHVHCIMLVVAFLCLLLVKVFAFLVSSGESSSKKSFSEIAIWSFEMPWMHVWTHEHKYVSYFRMRLTSNWFVAKSTRTNGHEGLSSLVDLDLTLFIILLFLVCSDDLVLVKYGIKGCLVRLYISIVHYLIFHFVWR